ncbi:MAG: NAD-dependent epimerase/dehydratase family protein [Candidatus Woesearchaeota archaeon]
MKILITGGAGFIGSHLCEALAQSSDYEISSLDDYSTGTKKNHVAGVKYFVGHTEEIDKIIQTSPDIIYHLGEYSRVEQSFYDMDRLIRSNINGTFKVLEFARQNGSKIIYAGSSTKFGDKGMNKKQSPYAWVKYFNTELVKNYKFWFDIDYAITYFYNAYGGREISEGDYATLIGIFKQKMLKNEQLPVVKPGTQTRNFTHVKDIVDALILVGEKGHGDGFGISSYDKYSIIDVAKMFGGKIMMIDERKGNRMMSDINNKRTLSLGWRPRRRLKKHIDEFKEELGQKT